MQIYINRDGQQFGPFTLEQVNDALAAGQLLATDLAFYEGLQQWVPLSQVQGVILPIAPAQEAIPAQLVSAGTGAETEPATAYDPAADVSDAAKAGDKQKYILYGGIGLGVVIVGFLLWHFVLSEPTIPPIDKPNKGEANKATPPPTPEPEPLYKEEDLPKDVTFQNVRDIFVAKCADCHKKDSKTTDLDLGTIEGVQAAINAGSVVAKMQPMKSDLVTRIELSEEDDDVMPPKGKGKGPLTDEEKKIIYAWVYQGAKTE